MDVYNTLAAPSENNPVAYYSSVAPGLFDGVMMKYMMPMPTGMSADSMQGMDMTSSMQATTTMDMSSSGTMQGMPGMEM
jgi:cytochrome o ubiquinol oxidase subunit II